MMFILILGLVFVSHYTVLGCTATGTVAPEERCDHGYYWQNGCEPCPSNCSQCLSDTNCTSCTADHYGLACETKCECEEKCHKKFGFCTFGCPDGKYSSKEDRTCRRCQEGCLVCSSSTQCWDVVCQQCPSCATCPACPTCPDCGIGIPDWLGIDSIILNVILVLLLCCSCYIGRNELKAFRDKIRQNLKGKWNSNNDISDRSSENSNDRRV